MSNDSIARRLRETCSFAKEPLVTVDTCFGGRLIELTHARAEKMRADNERLLAGIAHKKLENEIERLEDENLELRQFATTTWELLTRNEPVFVWRGLQKKARELGVEADK